jgi:hypothetical protein
MADIEIKCPVCERTVTISEFVDGDSLYCNSCGEKLRMPSSVPHAGRKKPTVNRPVITGQTTSIVPEPEPEEGGDTTAWRFHRHTQKKREAEQKSKKLHIGPAVISWLIFALLAALTFSLKYRNILPEQYHKDFAFYAPFVVLAFYVLIVLKAFKDSVFHGVLCLLLPPYSLYYIFLVSDDFYMRAVFAGLLVGLGQDTFLLLKVVALEAYDIISKFIGGGALKP